MKRSVTAILLSASSLGVALAATDIVVDSPTASTVSTTAAFDTVTVTGTGSITPPDSNLGISASFGNHAITVQAGGAITVTNTFATGIMASGNNNTTSNFGTVTGTAVGNVVRGIVSNGDTQQVLNQGHIETSSNLGFAIHTSTANAATNMVENGDSGTIVTHGGQGNGMRAEGGGILVNRGSIQTNGTNADAINANGGNSTLNNIGQITTFGDDAWGMIAGGPNNSFLNSGSITTHGTDAVGVRAATSGTFENHGSIMTTGGGNAYAVSLNGDMVFDNYGLAQADLAPAISCNEDSTGVVVNLRTGSNTIGGMRGPGPCTLNVYSGATVTVRVDDVGNSDLIDMVGPVNLSGGTVRVQMAPGAYQGQQTYTIVQAAGGISGAFSNAVTNSADFVAFVTIDGDTAYLHVFRWRVIPGQAPVSAPVPVVSGWSLLLLSLGLGALALWRVRSAGAT